MLRGFQSCDSAPEGRQGITQVSATRLNTSAFLPDVEEAILDSRPCAVFRHGTAIERHGYRKARLGESSYENHGSTRCATTIVARPEILAKKITRGAAVPVGSCRRTASAFVGIRRHLTS